MSALADGRYDVFILDAEILDARTMRVEFAFVSGEEKGDVLAVRGPHLARVATSLIGLPATLLVVDGAPRIELERV